MKLNIQLFADGKVVIETKLDTSGFEEGLEDMESSSKLSQIIGLIQEKLNKISDDIKDVIQNAGDGLKGLAKKITGVGAVALKTIGKVILKVATLGVALVAALGIAALIGLAFLAITEAAKKIGEENQTLKNDIQYIIFAIKTALQPVIDWIVNALVNIINFLITIAKYIMAIVNAIAGKNLFEKATPEAFAKAMKDAEKSSKKTAGHAKEIKKQLAGFDEMNILQDTSSSGAGMGGAQNDYKVSFDASNMPEIQKNVQKVIDGFKKLEEENTLANRNMILNSDKTWGLLKLGWWDTYQGIVGMFKGIGELLLGPFLAIVGIFIGLFTGKWDLFIKGIKMTIEGFKDFFIGVFQFIIGQVELIIGALWGALKKAYDWALQLIDKIHTALMKFLEKGKQAFDKLPGWAQKLIKGIANIIIMGLNAVLSALNLILAPLRTLIWGIGKITGKNWSLNDVKIQYIPKLAKGGIINQPGRGTPIAYGGERGAEGVIPLTDAQQMQMLGEAIGRYITINASITNTMNGRIISRELQKINNENSFAMNR